ncbi:MAG TPA: XdhC family protein [Mycobacteriales bacterium]|jgi:xanthine/CO dehydrogenase XdhC/CoxF family maturation factor|nr:XdhC family protein [Mycobacteriales bacterium]
MVTTHGHEPGAPPIDVACAIAHGDLPVGQHERRLVLVFDSPVARELGHLAPRLGWEVVVLDPAVDGSEAGHAAEAKVIGLDANSDVVITDHDRPELGAMLAEILTHRPRWIGVMGSLRHTAPHVAALTERGVAAADIARVHRPIGLDIGSKSPAEIAVATLAGLLADRNGRSGGLFERHPG